MQPPSPDDMDDEENPFNLDSPKRHSDPAPCTSTTSDTLTQPTSSSAFAFSVPDLRAYGSGTLRGSSASPLRSPLLDGVRSGTASPARRPGPRRSRQQQAKQRRFSQGGLGLPGAPVGGATGSYFSSQPRRATHPNTSPRRHRRNSLWLDEDPWSQYR